MGCLRDVQSSYDLLRGPYGLDLLTSRSWDASIVVASGLPVTVTDTVDSKGIIRFALIHVGTPAAVEVAIGVPLRGPDKLLTMVSSGESAHFRKRRDDAADIDWLEPASPADPQGNWARGVSRNHLVFGSSPRAVEVAAAFLSGGAEADFPASSSTFHAVLDERALTGVGASLLARLKARLGKGIPDVSLLSQVGALDPRISRFGKTKELTIDASFMEQACSWTFTAKMPEAPPPNAAECVHGPLEELLATQADATVAAATFSTEAARLEGARDAKKYFKAIGLVSEEDAARASESLVSLASARGNNARWALEWSEMGYLAFGSLEIKDADAAAKALEQLRGVLAEKDEHVGLSLSMESTVLSAVGDAHRVRVLQRSAAKGEPKLLASVVLRQSSGRLAMGLGTDPAYALKKALPEKEASQPALSQDPSVATLIPLVDASANAHLYLDALEIAALARSPAPRERGPLVASFRLCEDPWIVKSGLSPLAFKALLGMLT